MLLNRTFALRSVTNSVISESLIELAAEKQRECLYMSSYYISLSEIAPSKQNCVREASCAINTTNFFGVMLIINIQNGITSHQFRSTFSSKDAYCFAEAPWVLKFNTGTRHPCIEATHSVL